jgi:hypothetical protein
MAKQSVHLDRQQAKAKKQKRLAIILVAVLGLVLVYEVPHTLKMMNHSAAAPVVETAGTPPAATPTTTPTAPPAAATAGLAPAPAPTSSLVASVQPTPDPGQLTEFARFASKDPFDPKIENATSAAPATPKVKTAPKIPGAPATPKAPPAPPPGSAVISVNGELMNVAVNSDFPTSGTVFNQVGAPLFHLLSLTQKTAKVAIAGGSYSDGSAALTLTVGTPVTLQNTADGTRYTLLLEPQGTQVPVTTTTSSSTTPTSTTPSVVPASGSGG